MFRNPLRAALVAVLFALTGAAMGAPGANAEIPSPPGGPILVVTDRETASGGYYGEILRAEGLNEFAVAGTDSLNPQTLAAYQVVVLGSTARIDDSGAPLGVSDAQASALGSWVAAGGNLIAMRPDKKLAGLLGLSDTGATLANGYVRVDASRPPGAGIVAQTMQFHGTADRYALNGATSVADLYSSASAATNQPAVTLHSVGAAGGQAAAFAYDLAKSVVQTRQGNPAWAGQKRDGESGPIRSDDLFFPDWVDFGKIRIPQADEQQRLLANLITHMNIDRTPLPRFWYLPRGEQAAVIMTGDDHGGGDSATTVHLDGFRQASTAGCSVADWECIRATSYMFPKPAIMSNAQAREFQAQGFELALHLDTGCSNYDTGSIEASWVDQLAAFDELWPDLADSRTNRTHCIAWSDWAGTPRSELRHGVRLDTNYYYWPEAWVQNRPGMFTGSGMPMRFADTDGSMIDVYQATTQMTDESGIDIPLHIRTLLDGALGANGYYGVFTANMHTDRSNASANAIVAEAKSRGVPVVSAVQMLDWLDGRDSSSFQGVSFAGNYLRFGVKRGAGSRGLETMLPASGATGTLNAITRDGTAIGAVSRTVKGIEYLVFDAVEGNYVATYGTPDTTPPETTILDGTIGAGTARFSFASNEGARFECRLDAGAFATCTSPVQYNGLSNGSHVFAVRAIDAGGNVDPSPATRTFTTTGAPSSGAVLGGSSARITILKRTIRASRNGIVRLRVKCPSTEPKCRLDIRLRRNGRELGRKKATVARGKTATVKIRLKQVDRDRLARKGRLRVNAVVRATDVDLNRAKTTTKIKLLAPGRR